jgi:hypothetical protein
MKCFSCGSSDIENRVCTYCGAAVSVSSISALRLLPDSASSAFRVDLSGSKLDQYSPSETIEILLTQIIVLLERRQWLDAVEASDLARRKFPDVVAFTQYGLVAAVAGDILKRQSLEQIREAMLLLIKSQDIPEEASNLNGYITECVNTIWCIPNRIRPFRVSEWEADDEIVAVAKFFCADALGQANLLFDHTGAVKDTVDPNLKARMDAVTAINDATDEAIETVLSSYGFQDASALKSAIEGSVKHKFIAGMSAVLDLIPTRREFYVSQIQGGGPDQESPDSAYVEFSMTLTRRGISPTFHGGAPKRAYNEIWWLLMKEEKSVLSALRFV